MFLCMDELLGNVISYLKDQVMLWIDNDCQERKIAFCIINHFQNNAGTDGKKIPHERKFRSFHVEFIFFNSVSTVS